MARTIYTLLVGIDNYPPSVNPLRGCVNDIRRVETLLKERIGRDEPLEQRILTDDKATWQGIVDGFRQHLTKAKAGDVALFYYSGHGSQAPSPPEFWPLEPDHLDETLVCWDSREPGRWDLADKELAQLIAEVAEKGAHIAVILDCCHSGSGTRNADVSDEEVRVRRVPTDQRLRPIETFLVTAAQATALSGGTRSLEGGGWYTLPRGRHVVLAACSPAEEAKELILGGEQRGAFSYFLLDTLQRAGQTLTYRDLFKRVNALVRARVSAQSPQLEATETPDLNQPFLGGAVAAGPVYFTLSNDKRRGWVIDGGAVHGIPAPSNGETTLLALFPFSATVDQLQSLRNALGEARITEVFAAQSAVTATVTSGAALDSGTTYKAVVTALPLPPLAVAFTGDEAALAHVRTALAQAGPDQKPSLLVREGNLAEAEVILRAEENNYRIRRKGDSSLLVVDTPGFNAAGAQLAVQRLEHIGRWRKVVELSNPASRLDPQAVRIEILQPDAAGQWQPAPAGANVRLDYEFKNGAWQQPTFKVKLTNTGNRRLFCMVFDLPETYGVFPLLPGGGVWLEPNQESWLNAGDPLYGEVPDNLWQAGVVELKDTLKLIVSTDETDGTLLQQEDLPLTVAPETAKSVRGITALNTLNRLMARVQTRALTLRPANTETLTDWRVAEVSFAVVRPLEATVIAKPGQRSVLGHNVTIQGHAKLQARARLTNLPQASRDLGNLTLPAVLRDHPEIAQPFEFTTSRSGEPGLSVLELDGVVDHTVVTPDEPLVVHIDQPLAEQDLLLPLGWDGEFFLPLGKVQRSATGVEVTLERLPAPTSEGSRDLKGSIKILFQKLVGQRFGRPYHYPLLRVGTVDDKGVVTYSTDGDLDVVRDKVASADTILLYVHGITGDTRLMTASARTEWLKLANPISGLQGRYDLILSFDYENLHTSIEENASLLKERLTAVGLGPQHGKTLHIVAHSMGGLVSRWFIEREGGGAAKMVQHLIMVGTPNGGSPWPTVQDWATAALGFGLNGLLGGWTVYAASALVGAVEYVDVALDEMQPDSNFLRQLARSPDPGVPYTIIAGDTRLIAAAWEKKANEEQSAAERLWNKIKPKQWFYKTLDLAFFRQPNDIAVSVESIRNVPDERTPAPRKIDPPVPCDHSAYFSTEDGLSTLLTAVKIS